MKTRINEDRKFPLFMIYIFLAYLILDQKVITLVLNIEKNIDILHISLFEILLQIIIILLELPTGILGDWYSKKKILIWSRIACFIYCILILMTNNFYMIVIAFVCLGITEALSSGTEDSFISEINQQEDKLMKKYMLFSVINQVSTISAVFLGGCLYVFNWKYIYILMGISQIISIIFLYCIPYKSVKLIKRDDENYLLSVKNILKNKELMLIGISGALFASIYSVYNIFLSLYLLNKKFSVINISIISCIQIILGFIIMILIGKYLQQKYTLNICIFTIFIFIIGLCMCLFTNKYVIVIGTIVASSFGMVFFPAITTLINEQLHDTNRAIGNSFFNMIQTIFMCITFVLIGNVSEVSNMIMIILLLFTIISGIFIYYIREQSKNE